MEDARRRIPAWPFLVPAALYLLGVSMVSSFTVDDAYISLRYAGNLASGDGLVFNPGGPRVEGFTNLLLVLLEAGMARVGVGGLRSAEVLVVLASVASLLGIVRFAMSRLGCDGRPRAIGAVAIACTVGTLVATSSPFVLWSVSGLETTLFCALLTAALIAHLAHVAGVAPRPACVLGIDALFLLAYMTRPEALLIWALAGLQAVVLVLRRPRPAHGRERLLSIVFGAACLLALSAWRLAYFGSLVPATSTAKLAAPSVEAWAGGAERFLGFLLVNGNFVVALIILVGLIASARRGRPTAAIGLLATAASVYAAYVVSLGARVAMDDAYRFHVPLIPLSALLLIEIAAENRSVLERRVRLSTALAVAAAVVLVPLRFADLRSAWTRDLNWGSVEYQIAGRDIPRGLERAHSALGRSLRLRAPRGATAVVYDAGAIPFFSNLKIIDTWSLVDPYLMAQKRRLRDARTREERDEVMTEMRSYVLRQDPEFILQDDLGLLDDPAVRARYRPLGEKYVYLDWYLCGPNRRCRYDLEPWVRSDVTLEPDASQPTALATQLR